jgi:hypothetical protein
MLQPSKPLGLCDRSGAKDVFIMLFSSYPEHIQTSLLLLNALLTVYTSSYSYFM